MRSKERGKDEVLFLMGYLAANVGDGLQTYFKGLRGIPIRAKQALP